MNGATIEKHEFSMKFKEKFWFLYDKKSLFYYVLSLIAIGCGFLIYALLTQNLTTPFSGDFAQQSIPFYYNFYDDWWTFFKTGKFPFYDTNTYLGADNVLANTYYGLFSPFTFSLLFFPRTFLQQAMSIMLIGKLVTAALLFRLYLRYIGCKEETARLFGIAYAFMGWTAYYLWFNTFAEALAFLPLILYGIEKVIKQKQIWAVSLGLFLTAIGNYFFLLTFGIFGVIYAAFRFFQTCKGRSIKDGFIIFGLGVVGFALGILLSSVITFPALLSSFGIERATSSKYLPTLKEALSNKDYKAFFKVIFTVWNPNDLKNIEGMEKHYYFCFAYPLASFFYPAISGRFVNLVHYSSFENVGSSMFIFTPYLIMLGACLYKSAKDRKISHFIALILIIFVLYTPFFYWLSGAFANVYGRWTIVVPTITLAYIAKNFDNREAFKKRTIAISGVIAIAIMIVTYFIAVDIVKKYGVDAEGYYTSYGYVVSTEKTVLLVIYELVLASVETLLISALWNKAKLTKVVKGFTIVEIVVMGIIFCNVHSLQPYYSRIGATAINGGQNEFRVETSIIKKINDADSSYFRVLSSRQIEGQPNLAQAEGFNGSSTFHTFYNTETDDFVKMAGIACHSTSWSGFNYAKHVYQTEFLGTKYIMAKDTETAYFNSLGEIAFYREPNVPLNFELNEEFTGNGYHVYENKYQINLGTSFTNLYWKTHNYDGTDYKNYYTNSNYAIGNTTFIKADETFMKGSIMNNEDIVEIMETYPGIFTSLEPQDLDAEVLHVKYPRIYAKSTLNADGIKQYQAFNPNNAESDIVPENLVENKQIDLYLNPEDNVPANAMQIVYEPQYGTTFPIGSKGGYYLIGYPVRDMYSGGTDYGACVWAIDINDNVICFDECRNQGIAGGNAWRSIYSKTPIKRFIICPLRGHYYNGYATIKLFYQPWDDILPILESAKSYELQDVTYNVNDFTFKTNYETERLVVTQLCYTDGWKVVAETSKGTEILKTYNATGGFLGFVAPRGEVSYKLSYMTPGLMNWLPVSLFSLVAILGISFVPVIIKKRRNK